MTTGQRPATVKVVVATTVMLSFISFWRASAIVLSDLASSAYYVGGIAEQAIGKSAPWFILGIMLFSYAVRAIYIESCSMFVRGGVYKVVHEAMGGTLAKFSVSALMFDYVLTGPISGVSAGLYLGGLINETGEQFSHCRACTCYPAVFRGRASRLVATIYFLAQEHHRAARVERKSPAHHAESPPSWRSSLIVWCVVTILMKGYQPVPLPTVRHNINFEPRGAWLATRHRGSRPSPFIAIMIGLGHSPAGHERLRNAGAGIPRNRASQAEESGTRRHHHFPVQHAVHLVDLVLSR